MLSEVLRNKDKLKITEVWNNPSYRSPHFLWVLIKCNYKFSQRLLEEIKILKYLFSSLSSYYLMPVHNYKRKRKVIMYVLVPTYFLCTSYDHYLLKALPTCLSNWTMSPCFTRTNYHHIFSQTQRNLFSFFSSFLFLSTLYSNLIKHFLS